jgi:glycosyltransferase involved in cell wall biosynthesis
VKKILFIAPGNSSHSIRWISYFEKKFKIYWISAHPFVKKIDFAKNYNIGKNFIFLIFSPFFLLVYALKIKPDIIHVHSIARNLYTSLFLFFFFKKRMIFTPWGSDIYYPNFFIKKLQNIFLKNTIFICDSFLLKEKIKKISGKNLIHKINFGINCGFFNKKEFDKKNFNGKNIVFCPRGYDDVYNNFLILKMIQRLKYKISNYIFIFVGRDGIKKKENIDFSKKLQVSNLCIFLSHVTQNQLRYFYNISEIVISASRSDAGISSAVAEAMSCENIVLITNNRDNPFWIKNGYNGFLFKNDDLKDIVKKFEAIIKLEHSYKQMIRRNARRTQIENNNFYTEMSKVNSVYNSIY